MGKETDIRAVEMVRRIRDRHADELRGKSNEEIIEFFRRAAEDFRQRTRARDRRTPTRRTQPAARRARRG